MEQAFWDLMKIVFFGFIGSIFILMAAWVFVRFLDFCELIDIDEEELVYAYAFSILIVLTSLLIQNSNWPAYFK